MNIEEYIAYCETKPGVTQSFPFDEETLVFKVLDRIFTITGLENDEFQINLKCDPVRAIELRERYPDIIPGFHMNKKHWNTVYCERDLSDKLIEELIDHSYDMVVKKMPKSKQIILNEGYPKF